jgi:hypothetical protein
MLINFGWNTLSDVFSTNKKVRCSQRLTAAANKRKFYCAHLTDRKIADINNDKYFNG